MYKCLECGSTELARVEYYESYHKFDIADNLERGNYIDLQELDITDIIIRCQNCYESFKIGQDKNGKNILVEDNDQWWLTQNLQTIVF